MAEPDAMIKDYAAAWNATGATERRALLERSVTEDVRVTEPPADLEGREALEGRIAAYQHDFPGARIDLASGVDEHHGWARYAWTIVGADGSRVLDGTDVVERSADGRLRRVVMFFGPLPGEG